MAPSCNTPPLPTYTPSSNPPRQHPHLPALREGPTYSIRVCSLLEACQYIGGIKKVDVSFEVRPGVSYYPAFLNTDDKTQACSSQTLATI